ncbi:MAG: U32 family peptidase [Oscillospiraceae bacterium]|jgi:putative protease|nr:U32 family peptidase [Oscillospiraceae bacterium]
MLEILSPAGSFEGVIASVQGGADAVYAGFGSYNARIGAKNLTRDEFGRAAEYCRVRGAKIYAALNTLVSDRELPEAVDCAKAAWTLGADAVIVQDIGLMRAIRQAVPSMPVHASTQMSIHDLDGAKTAAAMGASRVVLARELSRGEIRHICKRSPVETEVFVHGSLCMCYSGQCYMSAVIGRRSGNRGLCAQPCRLNYGTEGRAGEYLLSLKDNCLVAYLRELESCGVTCVKIEGRMKRPEYAAIVTGIYTRAVKLRRDPSAGEMRALVSAFSRQGFTDGYYTGELGPAMFGVREEDGGRGDESVLSAAKKGYMNGEIQRVPVRFVGGVRAGEPAKIAAADEAGNTAVALGEIPESAFHRELTAAMLQTQLHKTGGTPFRCVGVKCTVEPGLSMPVASINEMRRGLLSELMEKRKYLEPREPGEFTAGFRLLNREDSPAVAVQVTRIAQLSEAMAALKPQMLYVPAEELGDCGEALEPFWKNGETVIAAVLPRVVHDGEKRALAGMLAIARGLGITDVLTGNLGQIVAAGSAGFTVRGDFGLNIFNSQSLRVVKDLGLRSATLSFELRLEQIRDISKGIDTEIITYGRLPLMFTENCVIKNSMGVCACDNFSGIKDRLGVSFPVIRSFGCRNTILNSKKLFMADKRQDTSSIGLWAERLLFTTENANECLAVLRRYLGLGDYAPGGFTRGLYYKGVE